MGVKKPAVISFDFNSTEYTLEDPCVCDVRVQKGHYDYEVVVRFRTRNVVQRPLAESYGPPFKKKTYYNGGAAADAYDPLDSRYFKCPHGIATGNGDLCMVCAQESAARSDVPLTCIRGHVYRKGDVFCAECLEEQAEDAINAEKGSKRVYPASTCPTCGAECTLDFGRACAKCENEDPRRTPQPHYVHFSVDFAAKAAEGFTYRCPLHFVQYTGVGKCPECARAGDVFDPTKQPEPRTVFNCSNGKHFWYSKAEADACRTCQDEFIAAAKRKASEYAKRAQQEKKEREDAARHERTRQQREEWEKQHNPFYGKYGGRADGNPGGASPFGAYKDFGEFFEAVMGASRPPPPPPKPGAPKTAKPWYIVLGFSSTEYTQGKITKAMLKDRRAKLALENHPDHGGSHEKMVEINNAFDIGKGACK